ncbi:MAG: pyridoxal phosphate-dependent aminotransferase [bacterium]
MAISRQISHQMEKASWIRRMFEQGMELKQIHGDQNVFDFTLGNPMFEPPEAFKQSLRDVVADPTLGLHRYMPNAGFPDVRRTIATAISDVQDAALTERHLIMTTGAASALNVVLKSLIDPEDEVIVLAPYFVEYLFYVSNHGGVSRVVQTDESFQLDAAAIQAALTPKTKAIVINSPNNPTGAVYPASSLNALADLLSAHRETTGRRVYVISDEPYRRLVYDGVEVPPLLRIFSDSIVCTSHAKDLSIPGERIGYIAIGPHCDQLEALANACSFSIRTLGFVNAPAIMQRAVAPLQQVSIDIDNYRRLRDQFFDGLTAIGYECVRPQGAFYLFPRCPVSDDIAFVNALMEHRILAVPGSGFGRPGYFRLAYCVAAETIERSLPAFRKAFAESQAES